MSTAGRTIEERAADWIAARDRAMGNGTWTPERQAELDAWLGESTLHLVAWLRLDAAWAQADRLAVLKPAHREAAATSGKPRSSRLGWLRMPLPRVRRAVGIPAALTLAVFLALSLHLLPGGQNYQTEVGAREIVALKDGSRVTLNTATQVHAKVATNSREVWLDRGEAYFEIAHDAAHPFVVHAGKHDITVLGTKFSVRRDGDDVKVVVSEGRVKVSAGTSTPTVLTRNEAAVADLDNVLVTHKTVEQVQADLTWLQGKLVFDSLTIGDAVREFNRYNRKQMVVDDPEAARIEIIGVFDADNVDAFARLLHVGFQLDVQTRGDEIHISLPKS